MSEEPRIGPFNMQVPPPSTNGSRVEHRSPFDALRRLAPAAVVTFVIALSTIPSPALLGTAHFTQWWHLLIAAGVGGAITGLATRSSWRAAVLTGGAVSAAALLLAYAVVQGKLDRTYTATGVLADIARLASWGIVVGGFAGVGGAAIANAVQHLSSRSRADRRV
ncbi:MAG: hypothetical protein ABR548_00950 [Actinomycetota bacterium]|nr:hypothetical protein [Actinomycetota bacterium]